MSVTPGVTRVDGRWPDRVLWLVVASTIVGAGVRFGGVLWGLPAQLHADEWVIVEYAIDMAQRNSFEPAFFARPDHLEIQLSYIAYQAWSHLVGGASPETIFEQTQAPFYAISRSITALFGTAMIPLAYLIGRPFARTAGLLMAVGVALYPPFVEHSRYATPDIPLTFMVMIVILAGVLYLRSPGWWPLVLGCIGVALGITVKYPAVIGTTVLATVIIIGAIRERRPWQILTRGLAAIGMVVGLTFLASPVLFTNGAEVVRQLTAQNSGGHLGAGGLGWGGNLAYYVAQMLDTGGILLAVFALVGVAWCVSRRTVLAVPLLLGVVYWLAISALSLHWSRWGLPMYLTVILFGALGVHGALTLLRERAGSPRWAPAVVAVLAGVSGLSLMAGATAQLALALAPDTRVTAASDLARLAATADNTAYDGYTPFRTDGPGTIASELTVRDGRVVPVSGDLGIDFALTSSSMTGRYLADPSRPEGAVYAALTETQEPIAEWGSIGGPPQSRLEPLQIVRSIGFVGAVLAGGSSGPHLALYSITP